MVLSKRFQSKTIHYYTHATHCHRESRKDRIKKKWIEESCREWNPDNIVDKCPKEILLDGTHRSLRELDSE